MNLSPPGLKLPHVARSTAADYMHVMTKRNFEVDPSERQHSKREGERNSAPAGSPHRGLPSAREHPPHDCSSRDANGKPSTRARAERDSHSSR